MMILYPLYPPVPFSKTHTHPTLGYMGMGFGGYGYGLPFWDPWVTHALPYINLTISNQAHKPVAGGTNYMSVPCS